jgi:hypothetical protein
MQTLAMLASTVASISVPTITHPLLPRVDGAVEAAVDDPLFGTVT